MNKRVERGGWFVDSKPPKAQSLSLIFVGALLASCSVDIDDFDEQTSTQWEELSHAESADSANGTGNQPSARTAPNIPDQYIVVFKPGVAVQGVRGRQAADVARTLQQAHGGRVLRTYEHALQGMAVHLPEPAVAALRADPRVAYVEEDGIVYASGTQDPAPWGLDRIDQRTLPLDTTYTYPGEGAGVHAYIIDSGVYAGHNELGDGAGGSRIGAGYDFIDNDSNPHDCHGHGTHVAGTAAGSHSGVAKRATVHGVRVLDCNGSGTASAMIAGIDWVTANHISPAVANVSIRSVFSQAINDAVTSSIAAGVTYAVSAGNNNSDACSQSPASTPNALTVGATSFDDARAWFSNYGTCVDLFAPGISITSAWIGSPSALQTLDGTSMAAPHVAGVAALYLGANPTAAPADVMSVLLSRASVGLVSNAGTGSPNRLLYMGDLLTNVAPTVNAGPDRSITLPSEAVLDGSVSDDGLPNPPGAVSIDWSVVSGPGTVSFANPGAIDTTASFSAPGTYVLRLNANDGALGASDDTTVTVNASSNAALKVQYRVAETAAFDNHIKPHLNIVNTGATSVPLSELKIRYWYTIDSQQTQSAWCDWAVLGCSKISQAFFPVSPARPNADYYLQVGFTSTAGSLAPGTQTGAIQLRFHKNNWSNYNETNDYSADLSRLSFVDWTRVTLYHKGTLVWGTEP